LKLGDMAGDRRFKITQRNHEVKTKGTFKFGCLLYKQPTKLHKFFEKHPKTEAGNILEGGFEVW